MAKAAESTETAGASLDAPAAVASFCAELLDLLFPGRRSFRGVRPGDFSACEGRLYRRIAGALSAMLGELLDSSSAARAVDTFMARLPAIQDVLQKDITAAYEGDPAAVSRHEVLLSYPCLKAIAIHRAAHELYLLKVPALPRMMSELAHSETGIDIHPGATIGERFFIDHGTGVVIGETTVIGRNVKLYQGVTLGALSFPKDEETGMLVKGIKRHPNVEDNVVIYAGATILGGETTIGHDSEIGGNVWLMASVPPCSRVYNHAPAPHIKSKRNCC